MASGKGQTPAVQAPNLGDKSKEITLKTNELKCCMASGNGRTPAVTQTADTSSERIEKPYVTANCLGNEWKCCIASGKGRTPAVTDLGDK